MQHWHASQKENVMCLLSSQSIGALGGPTEDTLPTVACAHFGRGLQIDIFPLLRARWSRVVYRAMVMYIFVTHLSDVFIAPLPSYTYYSIYRLHLTTNSLLPLPLLNLVSVSGKLLPTFARTLVLEM
jgi:hypothetical protein